MRRMNPSFRNRNIIFVILILAFAPVSSLLWAAPAIGLEVKELKTVAGSPIHVRYSTYPICESVIRLNENGNYVTLAPDNVTIVDNTLPAVPFEVSQPDAAGWQIVRWNNRSAGYGYNNSDIYNLSLYVNYNGMAATRTITATDTVASRVRLFVTKGPDDIESSFLYMGAVPTGTTASVVQNMIAYSCSMTPEGFLLLTTLDSVRIDNPDFRVTWYDTTEIVTPFQMRFVMRYPMRVWYTAKNDKCNSAMLHIYYSGGREETVQIVVNNEQTANESSIKLLYPTVGEHFSPCQEVTIRWTDYDPMRAIYIDVSYDEGNSWNQIDVIRNDSALVWTVPDRVTNKARIRVRQITETTRSNYLNQKKTGINKLAFSSDSKNLLSASNTGEIYEWDIPNYNKVCTYKTTAQASTFPSIRVKGVGYFDNDNRIFVVYSGLSSSSNDEIKFFSRNIADPTSSVQVPSNFKVRTAFLSNKYNTIALMPTLGTYLKLYSSTDGSFIRDIDFGKAISSFSINDVAGCAVVNFISGECKVYSLPNFSLTDEFDFSYMPVVTMSRISNDKNFIALGTKKTESNLVQGEECNAYIYDLSNKTFFRRLPSNNTDFVSLDFNTSSSRILVGANNTLSVDFFEFARMEYFMQPDGIITDFIYAPDGKTLASSSADGTNTICVSRVLLGEICEMKGNLTIEKPIVEIQDFKYDSKFIDTDNPMTINAAVCNKGNVQIVLKSSKFALNRNFKLLSPIDHDTIFPGQCKQLAISFIPMDTGFVADTLKIESCPSNYAIKVTGTGLPRNISFLRPSFDFGSVCVGEPKDMDFIFLKNEDPVPLRVNSIVIEDAYKSIFSVNSTFKDTIIPAGATLTVNFKFAPVDSNTINAKAFVMHSNQSYLIPHGVLTGKGITTYIETSLPDLRFIPEIDTRVVKLRNPNDVTIHIDKFEYSVASSVEVLTPAGFDLRPGEEKEITVKSLSLGATDLTIILSGSPCGAICRINTGKYTGQSEIAAENTSADPKEFVTIPIYYSTKENKPYLGERFFEATVAINPRIFLPIEVRSQYGKGTLVKNEISGDRRYITFRIDGDFPASGIVGELYGVAGLCETDTSVIEFVPQAKFWGESVTSTSRSGLFSLKNLCNGRKVLQSSIRLVAAYPVPATETVYLAFEADEASTCRLELFNSLGMPVLGKQETAISGGKNIIPINVTSLESGVYEGVLTSGQQRINFRVVVATR